MISRTLPVLASNFESSVAVPVLHQVEPPSSKRTTTSLLPFFVGGWTRTLLPGSIQHVTSGSTTNLISPNGRYVQSVLSLLIRRVSFRESDDLPSAASGSTRRKSPIDGACDFCGVHGCCATGAARPAPETTAAAAMAATAATVATSFMGGQSPTASRERQACRHGGAYSSPGASSAHSRFHSLSLSTAATRPHTWVSRSAGVDQRIPRQKRTAPSSPAVTSVVPSGVKATPVIARLRAVTGSRGSPSGRRVCTSH